MDPQQQQQLGGMIAGMMGMILLISLVIVAFFVFLFWRIFTKAGMAGPLALIVLLWPIGPLICLCILAFSDWRAPAVAANPYYPPTYPPPPPVYPPAA